MDLAAVGLLNSVAMAAPTSHGAVAVAADRVTVARFDAAMQVQDPALLAQPVDGVHMAASAPLRTDALNLGDKILAGLGQMGTQMQSSLGTVDAALRSTTPMTSADLLKAQLGVVQYSLELEYIGKLFGGVTRSIDQLSKLQ